MRSNARWSVRGVASVLALAALGSFGVAGAQTIDDACDIGDDPNGSGFVPRPGDVDGSGKTIVTDVQCQILGNLWALSLNTSGEPTCFNTDYYTANQGYILGGDLNCDGKNNVQDVQIDINFALSQSLSTAIDADQDDCVDACRADIDADGVPNFNDASPYDPRIGASTFTEVCDGVNNNADSAIDEGLTGTALFPDATVEDGTCSDLSFCNGVETCPAVPHYPIANGGVLITELMITPSGTGSPFFRQWVEIFNASDQTIDLRDWKLQGGTGELFTISGTQPIEFRPGTFAVLVGSADPELNGGISSSREFLVLEYSGVTLNSAADEVSILTDTNAVSDAVRWDATWSGLTGGSGASVRRMNWLTADWASIAQTSTASVTGTTNWAISPDQWVPAGVPLFEGSTGSETIPTTDAGSPGGFWTRADNPTGDVPASFGTWLSGGAIEAGPGTTAVRCAAGTTPDCSNAMDSMACVDTGCVEPLDDHPNAGSFGLSSTATAREDDLGYYDGTTGCLLFVADAYDDDDTGAMDTSTASLCDDSRSCTAEVCVIRAAEYTSMMTPDTAALPGGLDGFFDNGANGNSGCFYDQDTANTCGIGGSDSECNATFCVLNPNHSSVANVSGDAVYSAGLFGGDTNDSLAASGCYADVKFLEACTDTNACTQNVRCGFNGGVGTCDDFGGAGAIDQAQADANCLTDAIAANGGLAADLSCIDTACDTSGECVDVTNDTDTLAHLNAGSCFVPVADVSTSTATGRTCVAASGASDATNQGCRTCQPTAVAADNSANVEPRLNLAFYPGVATTSCYISGECYNEGEDMNRDTAITCQACLRGNAGLADDALNFSNKDLGGTCNDGLECIIGEACTAGGTCEGNAWEDTNCNNGTHANSSCGIATCDEATSGSAQCSWTARTDAGLAADGCFDPTAAALDQDSCLADGTADPNNRCQHCDPTQVRDGYSVRTFDATANRIYCDSDNPEVLVTEVSGILQNDATPCTVEICVLDGAGSLTGGCNSGTADWATYDFGNGNGASCPSVSCASPTAVSCGAGDTPQCQYDHVTGVNDECMSGDDTGGTAIAGCTGDATGASCTTAVYQAPECVAAATEDPDEPAGCNECNVAQNYLGFTPKASGTECGGNLGVCGEFRTCGGGSGALDSGAAGSCEDRGQWHDLFCGGAPDFACSANPTNGSCAMSGDLALSLDPNTDDTRYYDTDAITVALTSGFTPTERVCGVDWKLCGESCVIGGVTFSRGDLNPMNQCEWCNPDGTSTGWSARFDDPAITTDDAGYAATLAAAISNLTTAGSIGDWTFGQVGNQTVLSNLCRDDISDGAGADGAFCTVEYCGAAGTCGGSVAWGSLQSNLVDSHTGVADGFANCTPTTDPTGGQTGMVPSDFQAAGYDATTCASTACVEPSSGTIPTCQLSPDAGNSECFIGGRCHTEGDGNPFGGIGTAQCAACNSGSAPGAWTNIADATACNLDNNGCTLDVCTAGVCTAGPRPTAGDLTDSLTCTTDYCADGVLGANASTTANLAFVLLTSDTDPSDNNFEDNDYQNDTGDADSEYGNLAAETDFAAANILAMRTSGQGFTSIHRVDAGRCMIDNACYVDTVTAPSATTTFDADGETNNAACALCNVMSASETPVDDTANGQLMWSPNAGAICNDGIACTIGGACEGTVGRCNADEANSAANSLDGFAQSGVCFDNNPCTIDVCVDLDVTVLPGNELTGGADAYPGSVIAGCRFFAAATTNSCDDNDLCFFDETCAAPDNSEAGASTPGIYGSAAGQCALGTEVSCEDSNECTFNYCDSSTGGCETRSLGNVYFTGEFGDGLSPPSLGSTIEQTLDATFPFGGETGLEAYELAVQTGSGVTLTAETRQCDFADFCTAGTCNLAGACLVVDDSAKCDGTLSETECSEARCSSAGDIGTPPTDLASMASVDSDGCYLADLEGQSCNFDIIQVTNVCIDTGAGVNVCTSGSCVENGTTTAPLDVTCVDPNAGSNDEQCYDYTCVHGTLSTPANQCVYRLDGAATPTDNNVCTTDSCQITSGAGTDVQVVELVTALDTADAVDGTWSTECMTQGSCHPVVGWHPSAVAIGRIDTHASSTLGTDLVDSLAFVDPTDVSTIDNALLAAGSANPLTTPAESNATDLDNPGDVASYLACGDSDPCTGPNQCNYDRTCAQDPVDECAALDSNTLCVISGAAGTTVKCPIRIAAGAQADFAADTVAAGLQMRVRYDESRVSLQRAVTQVCLPFPFLLCNPVDQQLTGGVNVVSVQAHQFIAEPADLSTWDANGGQGEVLLATADGSSAAPLNRAYMNSDFAPMLDGNGLSTYDGTTGQVAETNYVDDDSPILFSFEFDIGSSDILPTNPVYVYASDIFATTPDALTLLDVHVWDNIIITSPYAPPAVTDCSALADATACDDGNPCTTGEACLGGACVGGTATTGVACDDGNSCTVGDFCDGSVCVPGTFTAGSSCDGFNTGLCGTACGTTAMCDDGFSSDAECDDPAPPTGATPQDYLACSGTGSSGDEFDCWLRVASDDVNGPHTVGLDFSLAFTDAEVSIVGVYDKLGKLLTNAAPDTDGTLNGTDFTSIATAGPTFTDIFGNPIQFPSERHAIFMVPNDPTTASGSLDATILPRFLDTGDSNEPALTDSFHSISPTGDAGVTDLQNTEYPTETNPGAFIRVRFAFDAAVTTETTSRIYYQDVLYQNCTGPSAGASVTPSDGAGVEIDREISNTVVKTGDASTFSTSDPADCP